MDTTRRSRLLGWLAVAAQAVALVGMVLSPPQLQPGPLLLTMIGVCLFLLGGAIAVVAIQNLGTALTPTPVPVTGGQLRRDGMYGRVRHPIYSGLLLLSLGFILCTPGPWRLLWWIALLVILFVKSAWEERMLSELHPEYSQYRQQVGRFLPRFRRR